MTVELKLPGMRHPQGILKLFPWLAYMEATDEGYDGAFFSGTAAEVMPIRELDRVEIGSGSDLNA